MDIFTSSEIKTINRVYREILNIKDLPYVILGGICVTFVALEKANIISTDQKYLVKRHLLSQRPTKELHPEFYDDRIKEDSLSYWGIMDENRQICEDSLQMRLRFVTKMIEITNQTNYKMSEHFTTLVVGFTKDESDYLNYELLETDHCTNMSHKDIESLRTDQTENVIKVVVNKNINFIDFYSEMFCKLKHVRKVQIFCVNPRGTLVDSIVWSDVSDGHRDLNDVMVKRYHEGGSEFLKWKINENGK